MEFIVIIFILATLFFIIQSANTDSSSKNGVDASKTIGKSENEYNIDLTIFPDRTDAIAFHKITFAKACQERNFKQANLSFAKLIESYRQQNINEQGRYDDMLARLMTDYDKFRAIFGLEYPVAFLPPNMRKPAEFAMAKNNGRVSISQNGETIHHLMQYCESPNNKFALCWQYSGELYIFEENKLVFKKKINTGIKRKPTIGNNGNFVFVSYVDSEPPHSLLYAFNLEKKLFAKKYKALISSASISPDGNYAICQTCNSDNNDGDTLSFFDLNKNERLWKVKSEVFWTDELRFDIDNKKIWFINEEYGEFAYNFDGCFVDKDKYQLERRKKAEPWEVCNEAKELLREINGTELDTGKKEEILNQIFALTEEALQKLESQDPANRNTETESLAHRLRGEFAEYKDKLPEAIESYEKALSLNPKIGVKQRLNKLKKRLRKDPV